MTFDRRTPTRVGPGAAHRGVRAPRGVYFLLAVVGVIITVAAIMLVAREQRGLATVQDVGNAYVAAVRSGDRAAIVKLTPSDFEVDAALDEKLALYATSGDTELRITYLPGDVTPNVVGARIEGDAVSDQILIQRFGSRWYLMIGHLRDQPPGPSPPPATTR